jgi:hypothetical protein
MAVTTGHRLTDLRYSAAALAATTGRPIPQRVTRRFAMYNSDRAWYGPEIDERCGQLERQARSRARVDLIAAVRSANTLLRVRAFQAAGTGPEDHLLDEIEDPLPYRPRGSAVW